MKILVANWFSSRGGEEKHVFDTLTRFAAQGRHELWLAAPKRGPWARDLAGLKGCTWVDVPFSSKGDLRSVARLARLLRRERFDVVHVHGARAGWLLRLAALAAGCRKVVWTMHLLIQDHVSRQPGWTKRFYAALERYLNRRTARIIAVSDNLRKGLLTSDPRLDPARVITVANGIAAPNPPAFPLKEKLGLRPSDRVGVAVGKLQREKGHDVAIRALAALPAEARPHLAVAGQGMLKEELRQLGESLGIAPWVHLMGYQDNVPGILQAAEFFLMPSRYEGFPIALLEAMALGKPIIAAAVNGIPEAIKHGENGLLFQSEDDRALAEAMRALDGDRKEAARLGANARRTYLDRYTLERCCGGIEEVYASLAA